MKVFITVSQESDIDIDIDVSAIMILLSNKELAETEFLKVIPTSGTTSNNYYTSFIKKSKSKI